MAALALGCGASRARPNRLGPDRHAVSPLSRRGYASAESMRRLIKNIAAKHPKVHFCYEAGPAGYRLYRLITTLGHSCTVVAPSLVVIYT